MGGEKFYVDEVLPGDTGSPPHGRGKGSCVRSRSSQPGITPAWAGKSAKVQGQFFELWDHPRMGGEKANLRV